MPESEEQLMSDSLQEDETTEEERVASAHSLAEAENEAAPSAEEVAAMYGAVSE